VKKSRLTLKIFALIVLNDVGDTIAQVFMKKGLIGHAGIMEAASSGLLWLGVLVQLLNFFVWIVILYKIDLSIAMPVGSTSYIFVPIVAMFFLHERVSLLRWVGVIFIILGIHFVSRSKKPIGSP